MWQNSYRNEVSLRTPETLFFLIPITLNYPVVSSLPANQWTHALHTVQMPTWQQHSGIPLMWRMQHMMGRQALDFIGCCSASPSHLVFLAASVLSWQGGNESTPHCVGGQFLCALLKSIWADPFFFWLLPILQVPDSLFRAVYGALQPRNSRLPLAREAFFCQSTTQPHIILWSLSIDVYIHQFGLDQNT